MFTYLLFTTFYHFATIKSSDSLAQLFSFITIFVTSHSSLHITHSRSYSFPASLVPLKTSNPNPNRNHYPVPTDDMSRASDDSIESPLNM